MIATPPPLDLAPTARAALWGLLVAGGAAALAGAWIDPARMWLAWLVAGQWLLGLALGGLCLVAIHYVTASSWSVVIRRVPEALAGMLPLASLAVMAAFVGRPQLYRWSSPDFWPATDTALAFKRAWLDWPLFMSRAVVCLVLWNIFGWAIRRCSLRQDLDGDEAWTRANARWSAAFLVVFGFTHSVASFDWLMSLEPTWYSSIFAVYNFAGLLVSGVAACIVLALWLEAAGPLRDLLRDDHLHDLGKLLFACSTFWMYVWFSQYMLIWYANIPEETMYYVRRTSDGWRPLFFLSLAMIGIAPFFVFLRRDAKRSRKLLLRVSLVVLAGRWLDLYLMIAPAHVPTPSGVVWQLALAGAAVGCAGLSLARVLGRAPAVPIRDPQLVESLRYEH